MSEGMDEIIEDFITEAEESLEKIDPLFVELEEMGYDRELLNKIFRSMHTIKGAAGFLGFQGIVDVAHNTETLLKRLRDDERPVSSTTTTIILNSIDMLKALLNHIKLKDGVQENISITLAELDRAIADLDAEAESADAAPDIAPEGSQERADQVLEEVMALQAEAMRTAQSAPPSPSAASGEAPSEKPASAPAASHVVHEAPSLDEINRLIQEAQQKLTPPVPPVTDKQEKKPSASAAPAKPESKPAAPAAEDIAGVVKKVTAAAAAAPAQASGQSDAKQAAPSASGKEPVATASTPAPGASAAPQTQQAAERSPQAAAAAAAAQQQGILQTLRVDVNRIDKVMNLTGEIVLVRNRLLNIASYLDQKYTGDEHVDGLQEAVSFLDLVTSDIQLAVMKMRMQPIKKVFGKFPRLVRDISQNLGKDVHLNIAGEDTEVDRTVIERIGDPLVHIIRNSIDHGIESVEERRRLGKPPKGAVDIRAYQQGSQIVIEVSDDGRGLDIERIRSKAVRSGLITEDEAQRMTEKEVTNLIFLPGFSTMDHATELSGRGVGMDVVKTNISKLNGYVEVVSERNRGTTMRISIPLTLAIIQALMVRTSGTQFAIPLGPIEETLKVSLKAVKHVAGQRVLSIRDRVYPLAELTKLLSLPESTVDFKDRYVLVIAVGDRQFCIAVDELLGQEEVVIKAIEGIDTDMTGILGATITGEGKIVLILDPASMSRVIAGLASV